MTTKEAIAEHQRLLGVLRNPTPAGLAREIALQTKNLRKLEAQMKESGAEPPATEEAAQQPVQRRKGKRGRMPAPGAGRSASSAIMDDMEAMMAKKPRK
jgi:hypothetical protein